MCGIFGAVKLTGGFDSHQISNFNKAVDIVNHRGPDSSGYKLFTNPQDNSSQVFLGHRRLSIIDLSESGRQPMERESVWIVFNGEIFNYIEVRETLKKLGHHFTSDSDTEVIIRTYQHYGPKGFDLFNGMWAFILFDSNKQEVVVSRDRFSIKPLYVSEDNGTLYFASELRQILLFKKSRQPNKEVLTTFLRQGILEHSTETFVEGIKKLAPKTNLVIDLINKTTKTETYWDYTDVGILSEGDAIEKFQETIRKSIALRLRSDVEIGCLLSGGLDSSLIAILANQIGEKPIRTFSVISEDKKMSEEKFIDIATREGGLLNQKILFDPATATDYIDICLSHQEQPFAGASVVAQYMIYELIHKQANIKVVLSGQGGDEALMGYLKYFYFYLGQLAKAKQYNKLFREVFFSMIYRTAIAQFNLGQAKRYIPGMSNHLTYINSDFPPVEIWKVNSIRDRQVSDLDRFSVPALTHYEDRNSMAHSIESRVPFLDHHLVNLLVQLPAQLKFKNGWSKYILRKGFPELPDEIRWRRDKKGFTVPEDRWCKTVLKEPIRSIMKNSRLAELGIINPQKFHDYFEQFLKNKSGTNSTEIFSLYIAEKWLLNLN
jgi:asparagine synthase (glutamine-hydrolysing)